MDTIPQRLLGEALLITEKKFPDKTAIISHGKEHSYSELKECANKLALHLIRSGIEKGDRVAIYMNNSWESIVSIYGATLAGAVFLVINPQTKANKLQYILNDSGVRILIAESALNKDINSATEGAETIKEIIIAGDAEQIQPPSHVRVSDLGQIEQDENGTAALPPIIPLDLAALIYTSGSTGFPKGVMMSHQNMVFTSWSLIEYLRLSENDRLLLLLPLAFDYGLYQLLMAVTIGGTLIVEQSFMFPASVYKNMEIYRPTVFPGVPTIYSMMITSHKETGKSFDYIKKITNTAAALPADVIPDLKKVFPNALIFKMYGLTECKRVCYLEPELIDRKPSSVGKAIPGTEISLLSPQGEPVAPGEPGILHVRGPHVMLGYWNKEDLSREMLRPGIYPYERILCSQDWFKADEEGFLYFLGRSDDIIKTRGEKVSPVEVENAIYKLPGIRETAVLGMPDEIMGESIVAFVTVHNTGTLSESEIQHECTKQLEMFMVPQRIVILDKMPKSQNGKIDKKELRKSLSQ